MRRLPIRNDDEDLGHARRPRRRGRAGRGALRRRRCRRAAEASPVSAAAQPAAVRRADRVLRVSLDKDVANRYPDFDRDEFQTMSEADRRGYETRLLKFFPRRHRRRAEHGASSAAGLADDRRPGSRSRRSAPSSCRPKRAASSTNSCRSTARTSRSASEWSPAMTTPRRLRPGRNPPRRRTAISSADVACSAKALAERFDRVR